MIGDEEQDLPSEASRVSSGGSGTETQHLESAVSKSPRRKPKNADRGEPTTRQIKRHTAAERTDKLRRIEEALGNGGVSLKAAVEAVGISDQTYYQWKRSEKPAEGASTPKLSSPSKAAATPSLSNELADLIELEEENQRLRQLLGEKLRAENAELRRRLELD
ncbi:transposase [Rhizobium sp. PP-F2F-G48]|uniref:transposase n=1 Tax=Rhizobium sp. PP-F2F-G48 TaxID=2135651 RepID=UPI00104BA339|nr:transposase [Rhizobium sp. PP-F2F-G48]